MAAALTLFLSLLFVTGGGGTPQRQAAPITFGETFTISSKTLNETRRINVYIPPLYGEPADARRPVLYMPDGGMAEDFLHMAGLVQVSVGNGTMRPVIRMMGSIAANERRANRPDPMRDAATRTRVAGSGSESRRASGIMRGSLIADTELCGSPAYGDDATHPPAAH